MTSVIPDATDEPPLRPTRPRAGLPLRGLVLDWGGVLTAPLDGAMTDWARRDGVDFDHFRDVMRAWAGPRRDGSDGSELSGPSPVHRLERGEVSAAEFERALAAELAVRGSRVEPAGLLERLLHGLARLDPGMVELVRRARAAGVRTALLSNSWGNEYPEELWEGLFDAVVISGRVGMRKPEPEIFRHTVDLLGLAPHECVMVDDLPHNVVGAVDVGMVAVRHTDLARTRDELEVLFGLPAAGPGA